MLSKLLAFGMTALTLAHAAPAKGDLASMAISCSLNVQSAHTFTNAMDFKPGTYIITSVAHGDNQPLRNFAANEPAIVGPEHPGTYAEWIIRRAPDDAFTLTNRATGLPLTANDDGSKLIRSSSHHDPAGAMPFAIEPAGNGVFEVKSVNRDLVWTVNDVSLRPAQGEESQLWKFHPVPEDIFYH
ncbi:hypothetical protein K438DRAFT_1967348 [Mycena galopus ATCC 62051]|nr:hypothetical protein K438DRAFT_1967348 [Mycena galopus ATCC 62051]